LADVSVFFRGVPFFFNQGRCICLTKLIHDHFASHPFPFSIHF